MDNELRPAWANPRGTRWPLRRSRRINRIVAVISWAGGFLSWPILYVAGGLASSLLKV